MNLIKIIFQIKLTYKKLPKGISINPNLNKKLPSFHLGVLFIYKI